MSEGIQICSPRFRIRHCRQIRKGICRKGNENHPYAEDRWRYHPSIDGCTASELDGVPVTLIAVDALLKFICVYKRYNLCKYCFSFVHSLQNCLFIPSCKTMISN